jgi:hypothetical protein
MSSLNGSRGSLSTSAKRSKADRSSLGDTYYLNGFVGTVLFVPPLLGLTPGCAAGIGTEVDSLVSGAVTAVSEPGGFVAVSTILLTVWVPITWAGTLVVRVVTTVGGFESAEVVAVTGSLTPVPESFVESVPGLW